MGGNADTATTNGITEFIRLAVVAELPVKDSTEKVFRVVEDTLDKTRKADNDSGYTWLINKLHFLKAGYSVRSNAVLLSSEYSISEDYDYKDVIARSNVLTREAMRHRKYGTKPAYIDASIGGSWVFYDGHDYVSTITKGAKSRTVRDRYNNVAAVVYHTEARNLRSLRLEVSYGEDGMGRIEGGLREAIPTLMLYIGKDGSIATDPDGVQDISLVLSDMPLQAAALKAEVASNFYDLSMPLSKARTSSASTGPLKRPEQPNYDPVQELLIPRIRYIENGQMDEDSTETDIVKSVRRHDVTWFVRSLPNGWKASPDARSVAAEYGIELAQNETFVKAHARGQGNNVLAHHAIRRHNV